MSKLQLKRVRTRLGLTQRELAERAKLADATVASAESGRRQIRLFSAYAILDVINDLRRQRGEPELDLDSLDWSVEE